MKIAKYILLIINIVFVVVISSAEQKGMREIFDRIIFPHKPIASSELREKGLPRDFYSAKRAFDDDIATAWVEGVEGDGIDEYIIFNLSYLQESDNFIKEKNKHIEVELTIINGVAKNRKIWEENNRVKKALLEVYEAGVSIRQIDPYIISKQEPILNKTFTIDMKDDIKPQKYLLRFRPIQSLESGTFVCIGKLIIKEVYPGTKYKDTGISEIQVKVLTED